MASSLGEKMDLIFVFSKVVKPWNYTLLVSQYLLWNCYRHNGQESLYHALVACVLHWQPCTVHCRWDLNTTLYCFLNPRLLGGRRVFFPPPHKLLSTGSHNDQPVLCLCLGLNLATVLSLGVRLGPILGCSDLTEREAKRDLAVAAQTVYLPCWCQWSVWERKHITKESWRKSVACLCEWVWLWTEALLTTVSLNLRGDIILLDNTS